jgi:hypothetical protein
MSTSIYPPTSPGPQTFSSLDGTIQGSIDGVNGTFQAGVVFQHIQVWRNGVFMTQGFDYQASPSGVTFVAGAIPQPGDILKFEGWI